MIRRVSLVDLSSKRRRLRRVLFWGGILLALGLLVAGVLWVVIYSNVFELKEIKIDGETYITEESIREFLRTRAARGAFTRFLGVDNILAWPRELSGEDLRELPALSTVKIYRNYAGHTVEAVVTERERVGIWCFVAKEPQRCYWFDRGGVLFMPGYYAEGNLTPVLEDRSRDALALGERVLPERNIPNLLSIFAALESIHLSVEEVRLDDLGKEEVVAYPHDGPRLLFSLRFPTTGVPAAIAAVAKITPLRDLQYIDFRVENKVYYR